MSKPTVKVKVTCPECGGNGRVYIDFDEYGLYYKTCKRCNGQGKVIIDAEVAEKVILKKDGYKVIVPKKETEKDEETDKDIENEPDSEI